MNYKALLAERLSELIDMQCDEICQILEVPSNPEMGDFSFPCFRLAKVLKKAPPVIAADLAAQFGQVYFIEEVKSVSGYLNFYVNKAVMAENVLQSVIVAGENYGASDLGHGKTITIDYSSPNIAKPFHIGHLRSTVIGNALYNIFGCLGYNVVGINHLGDWGTQFGKLIVAFKRWGDKSVIKKDGIRELVRIYVNFHDEAEKDDSLNDEARNWLLKMQQGDDEALELWQWFNEVSMQEFTAVYERLHIDFDAYTGESFYNDKMDAVVQELKDKKLLVESEGAQVVDLEAYHMPPCLILRRDGGTLYPTRDIAAAKYRKETYNFHKSLYLTGLEQNLHFAQWFKVIELMGYDWAKDLVHIPFGLVSLESGKLSTRKGNVIYMEDLLNEAVNKTLAIINEKNPDLKEKQSIAEQVGIGAIIFNDLFNSRIKDVTFSWERMLSFEGETAPYVQYTHARACSVLRKEGVIKAPDYKALDFTILTDDYAFDVIKLLYSFPEKIVDASEKYEPFVITRHLVDLAQAFNRFYHEDKVLVDEKEIRAARVALVFAVKSVLKRGLALIGVEAPEEM